MPPHGLYGRLRGVRFNEEEGYFEMLCPECERKHSGQYFWPLTIGDDGRPEFWIGRSLQRCRACNLEKKREAHRRENLDPAHREKRRLEAAAYYKENKRVVNMKHTIYMRGYRKRKKDEESAA